MPSVAAVSLTLGAFVENLTLTGTAVAGTGNELNNNLTGNGSGNPLSGLEGSDSLHGGGGNDTLVGGGGNDRLDGGAGNERLEGAGNDVFLVDHVGDVVIETAGGGTADQVSAAIACALGAEVENLLLTGSASVNGTGNGLENRITGYAGGNSLYGSGGNDALSGEAGNDALRGGTGTDTLTGGAGNDAFIFANAAEAGDVVTDFGGAAGNDGLFRVSAGGFGGGLVAGTTLAASQFQTRDDNVAQDSNDRFIFRNTDQTLWYDSDGSAAGGLTLIADLQAGATVTGGDVLLM